LQVNIVGINFKTADLALHEMVARGVENFLMEPSSRHPMILLSTCNRTEIYFSTEDPPFDWRRFFSFLPLHEQKNRLYSYSGTDCFFHLCKVAAGLDSAVFAETEILRQVKIAYTRASEQGRLSSSMHYLFQKAFKIAKAVRSHFFAKKTFPTLYSILWQLAGEELKNRDTMRVLLVGYSEIHRRFAAFLAYKGVQSVSFCTRFPKQIGLSNVYGREELQNWNQYDLISCATQADDFLIVGQGGKKHLIFDLSVPRNVDPAVISDRISLFNMEQINQLIGEKQDLLLQNLDLAEHFIWEHVIRLSFLYQKKLEIRMAGESGEGDYIANILHSSDK